MAITKTWYECPACKLQVPEEECFIDCKESVGMYGRIAIAIIYCSCGCKLAEEIIDNSGNIPPK